MHNINFSFQLTKPIHFVHNFQISHAPHEEILTIKDQLDPKIRFLANAPVTDSSGNKAQIRYSRKSKEQYVMTEVDKKPTGWKAFYRDGKWVTEVKERRQVKARKKVTKGKKTVKNDVKHVSSKYSDIEVQEYISQRFCHVKKSQKC